LQKGRGCAGWNYTPSVTETSLGGDDVRFRDTLWSAVLRAREAGTPEGRAAMERLARAYWKPVYFFVRRRGRTVEDAKDLAQGFFASLIEREALRAVEPGRGKFRSWLLTLLERFLSNERERERALKRGGGRAALPLDVAAVETDLAKRVVEAPEEAFERAWAAGVLARAFDSMRGEAQFEAVRLRLAEGMAPGEIGKKLGMGAKEVDNALHRGKKRLKERVMEEMKQEVGEGEDAEEEMRRLLARFSGTPS